MKQNLTNEAKLIFTSGWFPSCLQELSWVKKAGAARYRTGSGPDDMNYGTMEIFSLWMGENIRRVMTNNILSTRSRLENQVKMCWCCHVLILSPSFAKWRFLLFSTFGLVLFFSTSTMNNCFSHAWPLSSCFPSVLPAELQTGSFRKQPSGGKFCFSPSRVLLCVNEHIPVWEGDNNTIHTDNTLFIPQVSKQENRTSKCDNKNNQWINND